MKGFITLLHSSKVSTVITAVALAASLTGCGASTNLTGSWVAPDLTDPAGKKIAVFAITSKMDARQAFETAIVNDLNARGMVATRSLDVFGPGKVDEKNTDALKSRLEAEKYDAVVTVSVIDVSRQQNYVPGTMAYQPMSYYNGFYGYYSTMYGSVYEPGYYTTTTKVYVEANAYRISDGQLRYSAQTESVDPTDVNDMAMGFSQTLMDDLIAKGIFKQ